MVFGKKQGGVEYGKNDISTEQNQKSKDPWIPVENGNIKRPQSIGQTPRRRTQIVNCF